MSSPQRQPRATITVIGKGRGDLPKDPEKREAIREAVRKALARTAAQKTTAKK